VHRLPYGEYVHRGDPRGQVLKHRYKAYYHLPADLRIRLKK
jgi:hypothetical protein